MSKESRLKPKVQTYTVSWKAQNLLVAHVSAEKKTENVTRGYSAPLILRILCSNKKIQDETEIYPARNLKVVENYFILFKFLL